MTPYKTLYLYKEQKRTKMEAKGGLKMQKMTETEEFWHMKITCGFVCIEHEHEHEHEDEDEHPSLKKEKILQCGVA